MAGLAGSWWAGVILSPLPAAARLMTYGCSSP